MDVRIDLSDRKDIKSTISFTFKKDDVMTVIILAFDERPTIDVIASHISRVSKEIKL